MKIIKEITADEMVAIFLKAEINSDRWSHHPLMILKKLGVNREIIDKPDLSNVKHNQTRADILKVYRGYGKNENLFQNFPSDVVWKRILLTKEELAKVKYMDYSYWVAISKGTRLPQYAAETIQHGEKIFGESNEVFIKAAEVYKQGVTFPELILVAVNEKSNFVVLEGHLRITAYFLAPEFLPNKIEVIVGFSPKMQDWGSY